jgi:hypothetical protein
MDKIAHISFFLNDNRKDAGRDIFKAQNYSSQCSHENMFASELQKAQENIILQEEQSKQNTFNTTI